VEHFQKVGSTLSVRALKQHPALPRDGPVAKHDLRTRSLFLRISAACDQHHPTQQTFHVQTLLGARFVSVKCQVIG
jgi:hypothetical protein